MKYQQKGFLCFHLVIVDRRTTTHFLFRLIRGGLYSVGCHNNNKFIEKIWTLLHGTRVFYNI